MNKIAIYTLTSELHNEEAVAAVTSEFLSSLHIEYDFLGNDYASYGSHALNLIYVRTGGTEGIFLQLLPQLLEKSDKPFYLLTSGKSNSLAASMEILSYLHQQGFKGEIIHGDSEYITNRINTLLKAAEARQQLQGTRLGIIGQPSDWLISSHADKTMASQLWGIELVDIPMQELLDTIAATPMDETMNKEAPTEAIRQSLPAACQIYDALKTLVHRHRLQGFTLRCFDLLSAVHNTGCLALARLNAEGIVAGCTDGREWFSGQSCQHRPTNGHHGLCPLHHSAKHGRALRAGHALRVGHRRRYPWLHEGRSRHHLQDGRQPHTRTRLKQLSPSTLLHW